MAWFLAAKAPTEVVERRWTVPVDDGDTPSSASLSASGITIDLDEFEGCDLVLTLSAGAANVTGSIVTTITTSRGRTLVETLYIPIVLSTSSATTVQDICSFALRKVFGIGEVPDAENMDDAIERLGDMLEAWRQSGADIGAPRPLESSTVIYCPQGHVSAVKNNLILQLADLYGMTIAPVVALNARMGLAHVKAANMVEPRPIPSDY
jgi:hypothetical protein